VLGHCGGLTWVVCSTRVAMLPSYLWALCGVDMGCMLFACSNAAFIFMGTVLRALSKSIASATQDDPNQFQGTGRFDTANISVTRPYHPLLQPARGIIFDSCPCRLTPDVSARCVHTALLSAQQSSPPNREDLCYPFSCHSMVPSQRSFL
jgi:hypothetical protein